MSASTNEKIRRRGQVRCEMKMVVESKTKEVKYSTDVMWASKKRKNQLVDTEYTVAISWSDRYAKME